MRRFLAGITVAFAIASAPVAFAIASAPLSAQDAAVQAGLRVQSLVAQPAEVSLEAGSSAPLVIRALDANGQEVQAELRVFGRGVSWEDGRVTASRGGEAMVIASVGRHGSGASYDSDPDHGELACGGYDRDLGADRE